MKSDPSFLQTSLEQLLAITNDAYNEQIAPVAISLWKKHLSPKNPQWKFITAKPFYVNSKVGTAHVVAMVDQRLPKIGIVGYFACTNSAAGAKVLNQASNWIRQEFGLHDVYGPINGTLPSDYRLNLSDDFSFPGEPVNPLWHIDAFEEAGFEVYNRYVSGKSHINKLQMRIPFRRPKKGYRHLDVRPYSTDNSKRDFKIYHELRNAIFPLQSIYCPTISLPERTYNSTGKFDPNYTFFLLDQGREVGFIMAYVYDGELIIKTIGLIPEYQGKRLTRVLAKPIYEQAKKDGLSTAVYGMVRVGNTMYKNRNPTVKMFRNYVTMHKSL